MRHDLLPLPIAPGPPGVREAACARVLVASAGLAQACAARLLAAPHAAVPLPAVTAAAQQHLALAQRTRERPPGMTFGIPGLDSRHRPLRSEPPRASGVPAVLERWTCPVRRCNTSRALCALHGGARWFEQLSGRLGRRARSDSQGGTVLLLSLVHGKAPSASVPGSAGPGDDYPRRLPALTLLLFACHRRRLVHGGGRAALATNRPTAAVGKPCSPWPASPAACSMQPKPPAISFLHPRLTPACWVSFGERRWVSFGERQSR